MKSKMRIAIVDVFRGSSALCNALDKRGHEVYFISSDKISPRFAHSRIQVNLWKKTILLPYKNLPLFFDRICGYQPIIPHLLTILEEIEPDIVNAHEHTHMTTSLPVAWFKRGWKTVLTEHGCIWKRKRDKIITPFVRYFLFPFIDAFVAITPAAKQFLEENGARNVQVIGNSVDCQTFKPVIHISSRENIILFVGRLYAFKGIVYLLKAVKEVVREIPDSKLFIIGGGPLKDIIRKLSEKYEWIHYLGIKKRKELPRYYNMAKVFVLPSLHEPFGTVLVEAMACGTPVIGSNVEGIPYVIGEAGITIPPKDHRALKEAIITVLKKDEIAETLSKKGRERAVRLFSHEVAAKRYEALFYKILRG